NTLLNSSKNINTIDVNNISKGIYIFKLSNGTSVKTKKIVIR
ncbi:MAG: T9SS type A sorting domain-containing protein, partial [Flavobacteriaceae bacterium]